MAVAISGVTRVSSKMPLVGRDHLVRDLVTPNASRVPTTVAATVGITATSRLTRTEPSSALLWARVLYQRRLGCPKAVRDCLELNEYTTTTMTGTSRNNAVSVVTSHSPARPARGRRRGRATMTAGRAGAGGAAGGLASTVHHPRADQRPCGGHVGEGDDAEHPDQQDGQAGADRQATGGGGVVGDDVPDHVLVRRPEPLCRGGVADRRQGDEQAAG